mmetsp:Transcript_86946/g.202404  ORF Transcript_86946/g.202404 Transcript_86946/m.202404 type:complete len:212 (-) Transcript_86946:1302-1937(-)
MSPTCLNPQHCVSGFALLANHAGQACNLQPPHACTDLSPRCWQQAVAKHQVAADQLAHAELPLQRVVGGVRLRRQHKARAGHVQAVQQSIAMPNVQAQGPQARWQDRGQVAREPPNDRAFGLLVNLPTRWLQEHMPVWEVHLDQRFFVALPPLGTMHWKLWEHHATSTRVQLHAQERKPLGACGGSNLIQRSSEAQSPDNPQVGLCHLLQC